MRMALFLLLENVFHLHLLSTRALLSRDGRRGVVVVRSGGKAGGGIVAAGWWRASAARARGKAGDAIFFYFSFSPHRLIFHSIPGTSSNGACLSYLHPAMPPHGGWWRLGARLGGRRRPYLRLFPELRPQMMPCLNYPANGGRWWRHSARNIF